MDSDTFGLLLALSFFGIPQKHNTLPLHVKRGLGAQFMQTPTKTFVFSPSLRSLQIEH